MRIPHLQADSLDDLAFAQGEECARARTWQLDVERRRGEGRLSTLMGPAGVAWDVFARRALLPTTAERSYAALEPETQAFVAAYVAGVNAAIADGATSPEHERRGIAPEPWAVWTPVAVFQAAHVLFAQFPDKLWRGVLTEAVGDEVLATILAAPAPASGSNALALDGTRTASGLPLVSGDPHRVLEAPDVYRQVRLTTPDLDVTGFAFPGVPGVQHFAQAVSPDGGGAVAWGITNAMADYQDVYLETLERRRDEVVALGPDGWEPCLTWTESVAVLGADPVPVVVTVTPRGPVIDDSGLSLRTTAFALGECGFDALPRLLRARSVADVEAAFERWVEPVNNLLAADSTGVVVHRVVGRVPLRDRSRVPVPAHDPAYAWRGWVDLPRVDPVDGIVVSANDRVTSAWGAVGSDFAATFRRDRIRSLLSERSDWTASTVHAVLTDTRQTQGEGLLGLLVGLDGLSADASAFRDRLLAWDRAMDADSTLAAAFVVLREAVVARVLELPLLAAAREAAAYGPLFVAWFDLPLRVATGLHTFLAVAPGLGVDVLALLRSAVEAAASAPAVSWGSRHRFHPLTPSAYLGLDQPDDEWLDVLGEPLSGDNDCALATGSRPGTTRVHRGPVARYVWDLADPARSRWAVPLGPGAHDTDGFAAWRTGDLTEVPR